MFINLSSGTAEYVAAATLISMMHPDSIPFMIRTRDYVVSPEQICSICSINGSPVGITRETYNPQLIPKIDVKMPDENLVKSLRIYVNSNMRASSVIASLKENGLWVRDFDDGPNRKKYELVYYHRDFVKRWIAEGWVFKDEYRNRYLLTDKGERVLNTFYLE